MTSSKTTLKALEGYLQDVKPYHTKLRELRADYIFSDSMAVTFIEDTPFTKINLQNVWGKDDVGGWRLASVSDGTLSSKTYRIPATVIPRLSLNVGSAANPSSPAGYDPATPSTLGTPAPGDFMPPGEVDWFAGTDPDSWVNHFTWSHQKVSDQVPYEIGVTTYAPTVSSYSFTSGGVFWIILDVDITLDHTFASTVLGYSFATAPTMKDRSGATVTPDIYTAPGAAPIVRKQVQIYFDSTAESSMTLTDGYGNTHQFVFPVVPTAIIADLNAGTFSLSVRSFLMPYVTDFIYQFPQWYFYITGSRIYHLPLNAGVLVTVKEIPKYIGTDWIPLADRSGIFFLASPGAPDDAISFATMTPDRLLLSYNAPFDAEIASSYDDNRYDVTRYDSFSSTRIFDSDEFTITITATGVGSHTFHDAAIENKQKGDIFDLVVDSAAPVGEVWSVRAVSSTRFEVIGSVSGALPNIAPFGGSTQNIAVYGRLFDNGLISFVIKNTFVEYFMTLDPGSYLDLSPSYSVYLPFSYSGLFLHKYVQFTGVSGQYISAPHSAPLAISDKLTIEAKIHPASWTGSAPLILAKWGATSPAQSFVFGLSSLGRPTMSVNTSVGIQSATATVAATIPVTNPPLYVKVTFNASTGECKFYTGYDQGNYVQLGTTIMLTSSTIVQSLTPIEIGGFNQATSLRFIGKIYEVNVYDNIEAIDPVLSFNADDSIRGPDPIVSKRTKEVWTFFADLMIKQDDSSRALLEYPNYFPALSLRSEYGTMSEGPTYSPYLSTPRYLAPYGHIRRLTETNTTVSPNATNQAYYVFDFVSTPPTGTIIEFKVEQWSQFNEMVHVGIKDTYRIRERLLDAEYVDLVQDGYDVPPFDGGPMDGFARGVDGTLITGANEYSKTGVVDDLYYYDRLTHPHFLGAGAAATYMWAPDSAALSITDIIDVRCLVQLASWTPASQQILVEKWITTGNQRSFFLAIETTGRINFSVSTDGIAISVANVSSILGLAANTKIWVRATYTSNNGAGGNDTAFYTSTDGSTWTSVGTATRAGVTPIFDSTARLELGSSSLISTFNGKIFAEKIYHNIAGTLVSDLAFTASDVGASSVVAASGETWTVVAPGSIAAGTENNYVHNAYIGTGTYFNQGSWITTSGTIAGVNKLVLYHTYAAPPLVDVKVGGVIVTPDFISVDAARIQIGFNSITQFEVFIIDALTTFWVDETNDSMVTETLEPFIF